MDQPTFEEFAGVIREFTGLSPGSPGREFRVGELYEAVFA